MRVIDYSVIRILNVLTDSTSKDQQKAPIRLEEEQLELNQLKSEEAQFWLNFDLL